MPRTSNETRVTRDFWPKLKKSLASVPFAEEVIAAYYCAIDRRTPTRVRGVLLAALAYFVMPIDFLPDMFVLVGFTDDVAVLAAAFRMIQGHIADRHYEAADLALMDNPDIADGVRGK